MSDQLAAVRAAAAARYASHASKRRKKNPPKKNILAQEAKASGTPPQPTPTNEGDALGSVASRNEQPLDSVVSRAFKERVKQRGVVSGAKEVDKIVAEFLGLKNTTVQMFDKQGHVDSRSQAFHGGVISSDDEEKFLAGEMRKKNYHLRVEQTKSKKNILVARYYRSTGARKLLDEPVRLLTKDQLLEALSKIVEKSGTKRRKVEASKAITEAKLLSNSEVLLWNIVHHFQTVDAAIKGVESQK